MSIYNVIDQKVIDYAEIVVCLFDHCNLSCVFCPQIHDDILGASRDEILAKTDHIIEFINNNTRSKYFKVHLMGGELFQDVWLQKGFLSHYKEFADRIRSNISPDKDLVINFVTNLVFDDYQSVYNFIEDNDYDMSISYDLKGRFNVEQRKIFEHNVEIFKDKITMISMQMTKQNVLAMLEGDGYFDYLYNNFVVDWDSFIPAVEKSEWMMPKESQLLEFYKLLVSKYPKCLNVDHFVNQKEQNKMLCTRGNSTTILKDGTVPKGCSGALFIKEEKVDSTSDILLTSFFEKYNCFECEYFRRCPLTCFVKANYSRTVDDLDECVFKETFKFADSLYQSTSR